MKILVIDPLDNLRFLLQEELEEEGYEVFTACDNEEVLSKYRGFNPDLIILELRQKRTNEVSFEKLKKQYSPIPWIGYSTFTECPEEFRKWIHFYSQKSWTLDGLKGLIKGIAS